jgi:hypothetical protein
MHQIGEMVPGTVPILILPIHLDEAKANIE